MKLYNKIVNNYDLHNINKILVMNFKLIKDSMS